MRLGTKTVPLTRSEGQRIRQGRSVEPRQVEQYVEVGREATDRVFVLLVQFGDGRSPNYPDTDTNGDIPGPSTFSGPAANTIPAPDRRRDNTTIWRPTFNRGCGTS